MQRADVVVLVISASEGLSDQDARLASLAASQYKPILIVVNKWDLIEEKDSNTAKEYAQDIKDKLSNMSFIPVLFVSCLENQRVHKILSRVSDLAMASAKRVPTSQINVSLEKAVREHTPALIKSYNKRVKFYYATQVRSNPPTIVIKCNVADEIQPSYKRYLTKRLRRDLEYGDIPLRILFRAKSDKKPQKVGSSS